MLVMYLLRHLGGKMSEIWFIQEFGIAVVDVSLILLAVCFFAISDVTSLYI